MRFSISREDGENGSLIESIYCPMPVEELDEPDVGVCRSGIGRWPLITRISCLRDSKISAICSGMIIARASLMFWRIIAGEPSGAVAVAGMCEMSGVVNMLRADARSSR